MPRPQKEPYATEELEERKLNITLGGNGSALTEGVGLGGGLVQLMMQEQGN